MKIQSLSVVVPNLVCMNSCKTCPSRMHDNPYKNVIDDRRPDFGQCVEEYIKRLEFARHNGCNTVMLTGNSEPQQNRQFLSYFGLFQKMMKNPFQWVEMQTTGVGIDDDYLGFLRGHVGVQLISLSIFSFDARENLSIIRPPIGMSTDPMELARKIKNYGMSVRMSLNLTSYFDKYESCPEELFKIVKENNADQVTLRVLYESGQNLPEDVYVREHSAKASTVAALKEYILKEGKLLGVLPYGAKKYSVCGLSTVIDDDSMGKSAERREMEPEVYKYWILREDAKIYSEWDDKASLIF